MILVNAIKIIFLLGFLIFIHEGGHFLAAKLFKVKVENFSIGFGPKIFTKKGKETEYSISAIPFGGYIKMAGEFEKNDEPGSFNNAKVLHRILIVAAGPMINIIFGILVFFILSVFSGYNLSTTVSEIIPNANPTGIEIGDKILEINGEKIKVLVNRNGEKIELEVMPTEYNGMYILGIQVALASGNFKEKIYYGFWETVDFSLSIGESLKMLFTGNIGIEQMTGPIGISNIVAQTSGIYDFIYLLSLISLSLGVTNLLPIPALDGGRIVLLILEGIRGKALKEEIELGIQSLGFAVLILFSLYVSYNDILRIF